MSKNNIESFDSEEEYLRDEILKKEKDGLLIISRRDRILRGEKGEKGDRGDDGDDYILTDKDKKEIAKRVEVPIVEKVIEKTETIIEKPIVTNEIKEVAIHETAEEIASKLNELRNAIDFKVLNNIPDFLLATDIGQHGSGGGGGGGGSAITFKDEGTPITTSLISVLNVTGAGGSVTYSGNGVATLNLIGGATAAGNDTEVQFNDGGVFGGDAGMTYDKTTDTLTLLGDVKGGRIGMEDSNASHYLYLVETANLTADRTLSINTADSNRTLTLLANLNIPADPNADVLLFWDDSNGATGWLTLGSGLSISGTTITSSAAPGGSDTYVQFNDGGVMGGDSAFTWDKTSNILTITGTLELGQSDLNFGNSGTISNNGAGSFNLWFTGASNGYYFDAKIDCGDGFTGITANGDIDASAGVYKIGGVSGVSGSFTTVDGKTVTVTSGIITSIV